MTSETVLRSTLTIASIVDSDRITRFSVSVTDQLGLLLRHQWINQSIVQFVSHTSRISNPRRVTLGSADDRSYIAGTAGQATPCVCCFGAVQSSRRTRPKLTAQFVFDTSVIMTTYIHTIMFGVCLHKIGWNLTITGRKKLLGYT